MSPRRSLTPLPLLLSLALAPPGAAQDTPAPEPGAPAASSVVGSAHGAALVDGELWGGGPDYKVLFRDGGFAFTPALGAGAPRNFPVAFELESVARGGALILAADGRAAPVLGADGIVRYAHPSGIEERYEMRADGVEQSFVFTQPLPGTGELVVRGRLATDLAAPLGEHAELALTAADLGGVRFGAVAGADAAGLTAAGSLRYDGAALELVLPAAFVDGAAYPLVLDPLIGSAFEIPGLGTFDETRPDVAFDNGTSFYLVVWQRQYSSVDYDIHAQRISTAGLPVGGLIFIENAPDTYAVYPTVAGVVSTRSFLVAWQEKTTGSYNIMSRAVHSLDGSQSSIFGLATSSSDELEPDAGGERTTEDDDVLVVWERQNAGIFSAQVSVPSSGNPFIVNQTTIASDSRAYSAAISKSGGSSGRLLVTYNVLYAPGDVDVYVALLDRNGVLLDGPQGLATSLSDESEPDVDGDGSVWILAYELDAGSDSEIHCQRILFNGFSSTLFYGVSSAITADAVEQFDPAVAWTPGKAFVAWHQGDFFNNDVYVKGVDPNDCGTCEATLPLATGSLWEGLPKLASQYSGGSAGDQVLATWYSGIATIFGIDSTEIMAQRLEAFGGGSAVNLGGGCGGGGSIATSGAIAAGNPSFAVKLSGADPLATLALLVIRVPQPMFSCGGCSVMLAPSQYSVPLFAGGASQTVPLACDASVVGVQLDTQWVVLPTLSIPCPTFGHLGVSDRLRLTIGQ